jgi:hypothetical protein
MFSLFNVECKSVDKLFGVVVISKLSIVPFDKGACTYALDVLLRFEDSRKSIVEKKRKFELYWRFQWHHHHV